MISCHQLIFAHRVINIISFLQMWIIRSMPWTVYYHTLQCSGLFKCMLIDKKKHLVLYMPSYTGGKVLYSAQFIRSVLLHSRHLCNIFHFSLTEGAHSRWLLNLNTVLQHGDALNLFIENKKQNYAEFVFLREADGEGEHSLYQANISTMGMPQWWMRQRF